MLYINITFLSYSLNILQTSPADAPLLINSKFLALPLRNVHNLLSNVHNLLSHKPCAGSLRFDDKNMI